MLGPARRYEDAGWQCNTGVERGRVGWHLQGVFLLLFRPLSLGTECVVFVFSRASAESGLREILQPRSIYSLHTLRPVGCEGAFGFLVFFLLEDTRLQGTIPAVTFAGRTLHDLWGAREPGSAW